MSRGNKKARTQEGRGKCDNANTNKPIWVNFSNRHTSSYIRFWEFFAKAQFAHNSGRGLTPQKRQNACKRLCFRTLSAICILTRLPRASISWWRWTLVRYLGYSPLQIPDGSCDFRFSIACIINQLCDFVKWILKKFFGQAWKRLACEAWKRAEFPLTALERTRAIGIWPDIRSWTPADRVGHGGTFLDRTVRRGAGRRSAAGNSDRICCSYFIHQLQEQEQDCSRLFKMLIRAYRV